MACGIKFLSENLVNDSVISLSTGTQNSQFPLGNLQNESPAVKFRSLENNVVIVFDLQQTREIDSVAIVGDTNGTFGVTDATFKTSLTTDFSSSTAQSINLSAEFGMGYLFFTAVNHRYLELTLTGNGIYSELSNIFIGKQIHLEQMNISISSFRYGRSDKSTVSENKYGQYFIDKRNNLKYVSGKLEFCTKTEHDVLDEMFVRHQRSTPLWVFIDDESGGMVDGNFKLSVYGYLEDSPLWNASGGNHYSAQIRVNQAG